MDLVGIHEDDFEWLRGDNKLDGRGKGICRRLVAHANRKVIENAVRAPREETYRGGLDALVTAMKKEEEKVTIDVQTRVKVRC